LSARIDSDHALLTVADNGIGIPGKDQARAFQRFERLRGAQGRSSGPGLGLALVKSLIELHGGRIAIDSAAKTGTTVTCVVPVRAPREDSSSEPAAPAEAPSQPRRSEA
jgi:signal transduction histidine kinase